MKKNKNNTGIDRRDFLKRSAKGIAAASIPLLVSEEIIGNTATADVEMQEGKRPAPVQKKRIQNQINNGEIFDFIVIGSGFGASVAVTTLLEKKNDLKMMVLERGVWWLSPDREKPPYLEAHEREPVQYFTKPDHAHGMSYFLSIVDSSLLEFPRMPDPLYKHHSFKDIDVLTASGVGGGSLIYLNVTIRPNEENGEFPVLKNWPEPLTTSDYDSADYWMSRWRGRLSKIVTEFPINGLDPANLGDKEYLYLSKTRAFRKSVNVSSPNWTPIQDSVLKHPWKPAPLSINEYDPSNPDVIPMTGRDMEVCTREGRCFLGCPPRAIQTLDKTMLKHFLGNNEYKNFRLEGRREVRYIEEHTDGTFRVHFLDKGSENGNEHYYVAKKVILSAGTLGTNEILLRSNAKSRKGGLNLSDRVGFGFSGNGDLGGFIKNVGSKPDSNGKKKFLYNVYPTRGPLITSLSQYKATARGQTPIYMTVEDGGIPSTLAAFTKFLVDLASRLNGGSFRTHEIEDILKNASKGSLKDLLKSFSINPDPTDPKSFPTEHQLLENYFYFQCMGKDEPTGRFYLTKEGRFDLTYTSPPKDQPVFRYLKEIMTKIATEMGGDFVEFPTMLLPHPKLFTLHPLGGCAMGRSASEGAVNTKGQVFKGSSGTVYENLYVMDASVFPGPVAVNPTLTIVALSLKIADQIPI